MQIIFYLFFGILTTLINIVAFKIFINFHINYIVSTILAWIFSIIFAFITNQRYVFKYNSKKVKKEILDFFCARTISLAVDLLFMYLFINIMLIDKMISKIIVNVIIVIMNYIISKFYIFKKD